MSKIVDWRALDVTVIAVAVERIEGKWCAYIRGVPGYNHEDEVQDVKDWGNKLPESIALAIFPQMEGIEYAW